MIRIEGRVEERKSPGVARAFQLIVLHRFGLPSHVHPADQDLFSEGFVVGVVEDSLVLVDELLSAGFSVEELGFEAFEDADFSSEEGDHLFPEGER